MSEFTDILEKWKKNVLQLDAKNPLISFKPPRGAVEIDTDNPYQVFEDLIVKKSLTFDYARKLGTLFDDENDKPQLHTEKHYLSSKDENLLDLQRKLGLLRSRDQTWEQEQGINVLFLTLGRISWTDEEKDEQRKSPLLLLPCNLVRTSPRNPFQLEAEEDIPETNETLRVRFQQDFGYDLPEFDLSEEDDLSVSLKAYLEKIKKTEGYKEDWEIDERIFLSTFTSLKLAIYNDLDSIQDKGTNHPIINGFTKFNPSAPSKDQITGDLEDYSDLTGAKLDDLLDIKKETAVLTADYSQLLALNKLMEGKTFVLHGPPGTGKSQTIVNMIATCMFQGKSVLFVSEKKAALEVVKRRLQEVKLDDFALDLHNNSGLPKKTYIYKQLKDSLDAEMYAHEPLINVDELKQKRDALNLYTRKLHEKRAPINKSVFELYGHLSDLVDFPDIKIPELFLDSITEKRLNDVIGWLGQLEPRSREFKEHNTSKWKSLQIDNPELSLVRDITENAKKIEHFFDNCFKDASKIYSDIDLLPPQNISEIRAFIKCLSHLQTAPIISRELLESDEIETIELYKECESQINLQFKLDSLNEYLKNSFKREIPALDHQEIQKYFSFKNDAERVAIKIFSRDWQSLLITDSNIFLEKLQNILDILGNLDATLSDLEDLIGVKLENSLSLNEIHHLLHSDNDHFSVNDLEEDFVFNKNIKILRIYLDQISQNGLVPESWFLKHERLTKDRENTDRSILDLFCQAKEFVQDLDTNEKLWDELDPSIENYINYDVLMRYRTSYGNIFTRMFSSQYKKDRNIIRGSLKTQNSANHKVDFNKERELVERLFALINSRNSWHDIRNQLADLLEDDGINRKTNWDSWINMYKTFDLLRSVWPNSNQSYQKSIMNTESQERIKRLIDELNKLNSHVKALEFPETENKPTGKPIWVESDIKGLLKHVGDLLNASKSFQDNVLIPMGPLKPLVNPNFSKIKSIITKCKELEVVNAQITTTSKYPDFENDDNGNQAVNTWEGIKHSIEWIYEFKDLYTILSELHDGSDLDKESIGRLVYKPINKDDLENCLKDLSLIDDKYREFIAKIEENKIFKNSEYLQEDKAFQVIVTWAKELLTDTGSVNEWATYISLVKQLEHSFQFPIVDTLRDITDQSNEVNAIIMKRIYAKFIDKFRSEEPVLLSFHGESHEKLRDEFVNLDQKLGLEKTNRIREKVLRNYPMRISTSSNSSALATLKNETNKKRRQLPVRLLLRRIDDLIKTYKPCYLMSPLAVSQFVELKEGFFDVVIFDEASQIRPEEAIPSIIRAKQVVLAGDEHQMPPSRAFRSSSDDDEEEWDEEEWIEKIEDPDATSNQLSDKESILDVAISTIGTLFDETYLNVHYRSEHQSLIKFSNREFYDNKLITFPSSHLQNNKVGIETHFMPDATYDKGRTRHNSDEARKVVELVLDHMKSKPDESIGVAAISQAQQFHIEELLNQRLMEEEDLDERFAITHPEYFFVKNLENIQGDERDRIIISIAYGPSHKDDVTPANNFSGVNNPGGERRLNVLVTRARKKIDVVYSIKPGQITAKSTGARLLRSFLEYAEDPDKIFGADPITGEIRDHESPFETSVEKALTKRGYTVARQIGSGSYWIDLAIISEDKSGYDLGIECDGAMYHSSPTARDRDYGRQRILERKLGWKGKILRIWSTDWINNRDRELDKIDSKIKLIRENVSFDNSNEIFEQNIKNNARVFSINPKTYDDLNLQEYKKTFLKKQPGWKDIKTEPKGKIRDLIFEVVMFEGPVHKDVVLERIRDSYGLSVLRGSTRKYVEVEIDRILKDSGIVRESLPIQEEKGFLYYGKKQLTRTPRKAPDNNIEHYFFKDLEFVILNMVKNANMYFDVDGLITDTARTLKYTRTGTKIKNTLSEIIDSLVSEGKLIKGQDGNLKINSD